MNTLVPFWTIEPRHVQLGMLAMIRLSGLFVLMPPVQAPVVPVSVRVSLAASELGIGLALGFAARLVVTAASYAAELVAFQMGFGLSSILDPTQGQQMTVLARLFDWVVMMLFLALDGHYLLIGATVESFRVVPPGQLADFAAGANVLFPLGGRLFSIGLALVAPAIGVLFIANVALVLATRAVPALNLMAVGFPVLIMLGLIMTIVNLDLVAGVVGGEIRNLESVLVALLRSLGNGR